MIIYIIYNISLLSSYTIIIIKKQINLFLFTKFLKKKQSIIYGCLCQDGELPKKRKEKIENR